MSVPVRELSPEEEAAKYKLRRDLISIFALFGGTLLVTVSASLLYNVLVGLIILGSIFIVFAILIGYK